VLGDIAQHIKHGASGNKYWASFLPLFHSRQEVPHDELIQALLLVVAVTGKEAGGVDGRVRLVVAPACACARRRLQL
jgi:hypothetical protein